MTVSDLRRGRPGPRQPGYLDEWMDKVLTHAERLEAENKRLRELLARTHAAWMLEASQGDGIMEEHRQVDLDCRSALEGAKHDSR